MRILMPLLGEIPGFSSHQTGFYRDFFSGIAEALEAMGHVAITFPFDKQQQRAPQEWQSLYRLFTETRVDAVLDLCCWGYGLSHFVLYKQNGQSSPIYDMFDIPYVGMLLDHPFNQAINGIVARRLYATYPDRGHAEQLRLVYPELALSGSVFIPPAVKEKRVLPPAASSVRDIDVLYVGTLAIHALERFWHNPSNGYWRSSYDPELCDAIADCALAAPERSFHLAVQEVMAQAKARAPGFSLKEQLRAVEWHLRARYRLQAVQALAGSGVRMQIIGAGWDTVNLPASSGRLQGIDFDDMYRAAGSAKICLDASTYLDGANDRVFTYGSQGALTFTNAAGYLRAPFEGAMQFYSMQELGDLVAGVRGLLAQPARLREAGERARERIRASHTWRHRVTEILAHLQQAVA